MGERFKLGAQNAVECFQHGQHAVPFVFGLRWVLRLASAFQSVTLTNIQSKPCRCLRRLRS